ncbi:SNF-related serine/threonine-protein kinase [Oryzias melastigma]|uniref:SNF-related serine/threonine-protein kinase n=1 Tax=Oryzias melastigma TaxID=30732 RepID=A0A834FK20_ORYME|nr:SNF-related serine/threonine-protein kinase [Oryzias melastigma]
MDSFGDSASAGDGIVERRSSPGRADLSGLYRVGRTLGRGHFAVVKLARQVNTGQLVAVKIIDKTKLDVMATSHLLQEVRCMRLVQHPNVVQLHEVIDTPTTLYLVMELAEGGDLYDYILRHEGGVAEGTAKRHFAQIVQAVAYCHRLHVVHRDLKPENVVFFPQQGTVKLTDFGFSNLFKPGIMLATSCGSLAYSAPEILLGEEYDAPAVDIWSLGVILYMLVCGVPPFQETNDSETLVMILDCRYSVPEHISDNCRDLISRMLQRDPSRRASLEEIEGHQWLEGLDNNLLSPEPPPHWLSGALSPGSPCPGAPECGDLLAAKPTTQQTFPGPWQPSLSFSLRPPPAEEPPVSKTLPALQQICEEEEEEEEEEGEEEEEEEEEDEKESLVKGEPEEMVEQEVKEEEKQLEAMNEDSGCVISDQPVSQGEESLSQTPEAPPSSLRSFAVSCCQSQPYISAEEDEEPNNNTNKSFHALPQSASCHSCLPASSASPDATEGKPGGCQRDDLLKERSQSQSVLETRDESALRADQGKRHSVKLRDRLFQFPLCEKALAFNIPTHNKPKILPLAQYNCCHVL